MDALGALSAVPHTGTSMLKAGWDAVTVSGLVPADVAMFTVGVRPATYRNGATACICAADRRQPVVVVQPEDVVQPEGDVLLSWAGV